MAENVSSGLADLYSTDSGLSVLISPGLFLATLSLKQNEPREETICESKVTVAGLYITYRTHVWCDICSQYSLQTYQRCQALPS